VGIRTIKPNLWLFFIPPKIVKLVFVTFFIAPKITSLILEMVLEFPRIIGSSFKNWN
jgi:hypothetical protein